MTIDGWWLIIVWIVEGWGGFGLDKSGGGGLDNCDLAEAGGEGWVDTW